MMQPANEASRQADAETALDKARWFARQNKFSTAIRVVEKVLRKHPGLEGAQELLVDLRQQRRDYLYGSSEQQPRQQHGYGNDDGRGREGARAEERREGDDHAQSMDVRAMWDHSWTQMERYWDRTVKQRWYPAEYRNAEILGSYKSIVRWLIVINVILLVLRFVILRRPLNGNHYGNEDDLHSHSHHHYRRSGNGRGGIDATGSVRRGGSTFVFTPFGGIYLGGDHGSHGYSTLFSVLFSLGFMFLPMLLRRR